MNVVTERLPESRVVLDIQAEDQEFEKALDRAYRKIVQQVRLPGFRPGKAPRKIIENLLGREVLVEQADKDLLDPLYQQALEREQLNPVSEPEVEIYQTAPLAFKVTVQVYPTVEPGDYTALRVEPRHVEVTDEQVEEALERLQRQHSPWEDPAEPRPVQEGDRVTLDVEVMEGEQEFRAPLRDAPFTLGQDNLLPQLREAILGMSIGESKDVRITFAEDDANADAEMRGKTLDYRVTVKGLQEQHLLPFDDDFARKASNDRLETLDALRDGVRKDLLTAERQKARNEVGTEAINGLGALAAVEIPQAMVDRQVDTEVDNLRTSLRDNQGQTLEGYLRLEGKTEEQLREELRPEATRRLRNSLVLREIATREGISVGPQDVDAEIDRLVGVGGDQERMRQLYSSRYVREVLENELFERKLMDRVIEIATEGRGAFEPPEETEEPEESAAPAATGQPDESATPVGASEATEAEAAQLAAADDEVGVVGVPAPSGDAAATDDRAGILPEDRHIAIGGAEAVAATETVVPATAAGSAGGAGGEGGEETRPAGAPGMTDAPSGVGGE